MGLNVSERKGKRSKIGRANYIVKQDLRAEDLSELGPIIGSPESRLIFQNWDPLQEVLKPG